MKCLSSVDKFGRHSVADPKKVDANLNPAFHFDVVQIRIRLFTLIWIRIRLSSKWFESVTPRSTDSPRLHCELPRLHCEAPQLHFEPLKFLDWWLWCEPGSDFWLCCGSGFEFGFALLCASATLVGTVSDQQHLLFADSSIFFHLSGAGGCSYPSSSGSSCPTGSVSDPYSFFPDPDPDPEFEAGDQYGSGSGSNPDPGL